MTFPLTVSAQRPYLVRSQVIAVVDDIVYAATPDEAIALVLDGRGDRLSTSIDSRLAPLSVTAERELEELTATA